MLFRHPTSSPRSLQPASRERVLVSALALLAALTCVWGAVGGHSLAEGRAPWEREPPPEPNYPDVSASVRWLASRLGSRDIVIIDARTPDAYDLGHIPGALLLSPGLTSDTDALTRALGERGLTGRERLICYGENSRSGRAARLFWLLELAGAERVMLLEGGHEAWRDAGLELTREVGEAPVATWAPKPRPDLLATREHVRRSFGVGGFELLDARGRETWKGPLEQRDWGSTRRVGHIPNALPFDWWDFFEPDGTLKSPSESWFTFAELGPRPANPVDVSWEFIVYGGGSEGGEESGLVPSRDGMTGDGSSGGDLTDHETDDLTGEGALAYFLLRRAGVSRLRYYPGGWNDWAGDDSLPVVRIIGARELQWRLKKSGGWFRRDAPPADFALFDVRHPADYARGHIPGAVNLRSDYFADSLDARIERYWPSLNRSRAPVVTYCYGELCIRSRATSTETARAGFVYAERFFGGVNEWRSIGGRIKTER